MTQTPDPVIAFLNAHNTHPKDGWILSVHSPRHPTRILTHTRPHITNPKSLHTLLAWRLRDLVLSTRESPITPPQSVWDTGGQHGKGFVLERQTQHTPKMPLSLDVTLDTTVFNPQHNPQITLNVNDHTLDVTMDILTNSSPSRGDKPQDEQRHAQRLIHIQNTTQHHPEKAKHMAFCLGAMTAMPMHNIMDILRATNRLRASLMACFETAGIQTPDLNHGLRFSHVLLPDPGWLPSTPFGTDLTRSFWLADTQTHLCEKAQKLGRRWMEILLQHPDIANALTHNADGNAHLTLTRKRAVQTFVNLFPLIAKDTTP